MFNDKEMFLARLKVLAEDLYETARKKNADYATNADPFANFRASLELGVPVARGILVRMSDKMSRISTLLDKPPDVVCESVADTCSDLANYALILRVWLEWQAEGPEFVDIDSDTNANSLCPFCGGDIVPHIEVHGHWQTGCCQQVMDTCCEGTEHKPA